MELMWDNMVWIITAIAVVCLGEALYKMYQDYRNTP